MKQKKKIKKKKTEIPEIPIQTEKEVFIPPSHDKEGNVNFYSEEVAKGIIELFISLTVSINFVRNTQKKIYDFCFTEMSQRLNDLVQLCNINHEIDDLHNSEYILSNIKYLKTDTNEKRYKEVIHKKANYIRNLQATKVLFHMANIDKIEFAGMLIKNKEIKDYLNKSTTNQNEIDLIRNNREQYDIEITKYNYWGNIPQPKSYFIDRTSSLYNNLKKDQQIITKKNPPKRNSLKKHVTYRSKYSIRQLTKLTTLKEETEIPKKVKFMPILEMEVVELPKEENKIKEPEEIENIRKDTLKVEQAKKEKLKLLELSKKEKEKNDVIKGKYTTDVEGKIVMIKEILPESLLKDFSPVSTQHKELLTGKSVEELEIENALLEKKAKKNIIFNNSPNTNTFINREIDKDNKTNINLTLGPSQFDLLNPVSIGLSQRLHKNEKIVLSGSNFKLMNPSPGVNIKERHNIKQGGIDFFKTFHKYSLDEFNKVLKETLDWEKAKLSGKYFSNSLTPLNNMNINKSDDKSHKLNMKFNAKKINLQQYSNKNKKNFRKTFTENFKPKTLGQKPMKEMFTLNEKKMTNLKEIFINEDKDLAMSSNFDKKKKLKKISSYSNIFSRYILTPNEKTQENKKVFKFNLMDNFNRDLIAGYFRQDKGNYVLPKLPPKTKINVNQIISNFNGMNKTSSIFYRTRQKRNQTELVQSLSTNLPVKNKDKIE